eukprot:TRINITY_DN112828_c0_g1_i1.p1 TRINITY_DN112828_c0_g1~~TRINITY_DN112828_c0_g1_i1.p1  ORF type:complete len:641 (-),score=140.69 TRINITY_DN112828_c0_g1_i1:54-1976(-)
MTTAQLMLERVADDIAKLAAGEDGNQTVAAALLTGGDPSSQVGPHLEAPLEHHGHRAQVAALLFQRFHGTVTGASKQPALECLASAVQQKAIPTLQRLEKCIVGRRAFQNAFSLAPLLSRTVGLAAQCCGVAVRGVTDVRSILMLTSLVQELMKAVEEAVLDRVAQFRPMDSSRLYSAHQVFAAQQAELAQAFQAAGIAAEQAARLSLAPPPDRPRHQWRNDELRQFWEARCAPKWEGGVPVDALSLLLLRAASVDCSLSSQEAVMRRLSNIEARKEPNGIEASELDRCGPEVRRAGGLKAWVNALLVPGGLPPSGGVPGVGPFGAPKRLALGCTTTTLGSAGNTTMTPGTSASNWRSTGASMALSARGERRKPFAISYTAARRPPTDDEGWLQNGAGETVMDAVEMGLLKTSQRLVMGNKLTVNARNGTWRDTALHTAAGQDGGTRAPLAALLLREGADLNAEDKHLATPLHFAASAGRPEVAKRLVQLGADVHKEDRWQSTALHRAADNGQAEVAQLLIQNGALSSVADAWGATPLHRAATRGQFGVAEKLLLAGGSDLEAEDSTGMRPMHIAARNGDYALVKLLLEWGAMATAVSSFSGKTPEDCARERGHKDIVTLLRHRDEWVTPRSQAVAVRAA